jgi:hypothetical protein
VEQGYDGYGSFGFELQVVAKADHHRVCAASSGMGFDLRRVIEMLDYDASGGAGLHFFPLARIN